MRNLFLLLIAILFLNACTNANKTESSAIKQSDTLLYTYKSIYKRSSNIVKTDGKLETTYIRVSYPQYTVGKINNFIRKQLVVSDDPDKTYTSAEEMVSGFIADFDQFFKEQKEFPRPWFRDLKIRVVSQSSKLISFERVYSDYLGGAHGNYGTIYYNYDRVNNKNTTLNDLFTKENLVKVTAVADSIFRKNENLDPDAKLDAYFFDNNTFKLNENFIPVEAGLKFFYNIYEIKPYAAGTTELIVPYSALKGLVKPNSILSSYL